MKDSLAYVQTAPAISEAQLSALAARAWLDHGIVLLRPEDMPDPLDRRAALEMAEKLYGKRHDF